MATRHFEYKLEGNNPIASLPSVNDPQFAQILPTLPITTIMEIFTHLPLDNLLPLCKNNTTFRDICENEDFWRRRVIANLPSAYQNKPQDMSWRDWSQFWDTHSVDDKINKELNLSPEEGYIRLITAEGNIVKGSELYQEINILLPRAIRKYDIDLIIYFMKLYEESKSPKKLNYGEAVSDILRLIYYYADKKDIPLLTEYLEILLEDLDFIITTSLREKRNGLEDYLEIAETLGEIGNLEIRDEILGRVDDREEYNFLGALYTGMVNGGHIRGINAYDFDILGVDEVADLYDLAERVGNISFLDYIKENFTPEYNRTITTLVAKKRMPRKRKEDKYRRFLDDRDRTCNFEKVTELVKMGYHVPEILDYKNCSDDEIIAAVILIKDREEYDRLISHIIREGRYTLFEEYIDMVTKIDYAVVLTAIANGYRDIALYLILKGGNDQIYSLLKKDNSPFYSLVGKLGSEIRNIDIPSLLREHIE